MSTPPTISVVIPCYNGARFLRETLESVRAQTYPVLEVLVVDDGSTDDSAAIAESYGGPVRVLRQRNQGESVARNRGLDEAQGAWVAFLDADDLWKPEKLEWQLAAATPEVIAVHTAYFAFGNDDYLVQPHLEPEAQRYSLQRICVKGNPCMPSSLLVRRTVPVRFPTWTQYSEDTVYTLELLRHGKIAVVPEPLTGYRTHAHQQSSPLAVQIEWQTTINRWLRENQEDVPAQQVEAIQTAWIEKLARVATLAYWQRAWNDYWAIRRHLEKYPEHPAVQRLVNQRIYPAWMYKVKDSVDRLAGRQPGLRNGLRP